MTRNQRQRRLAPSLAKHQPVDWKAHPVVVAAGSAAATTLLCIAIVTQLIIPTQTAKLEIEVLKLKDAAKEAETKSDGQLSTIRRQRSQIGGLERTLAATKQDLEHARTELSQARADELFSPGNAYPKGLALVQVGMPITEVAKNYPSEQIVEDKNQTDSVTVKVLNSPIDKVTYFFDEKSRSKRITHIAFDGDLFEERPKGFFRYKITEAFGAATFNPRPGYYAWSIKSQKLKIVLWSEIGFLVMGEQDWPAIWPE